MNREPSAPFYMQNAFNLHQHEATVTVTTSKLMSPLDWKMQGLGDVFPIHQTKYAVFWNDEASSPKTHLEALNAELSKSGQPPRFLEILHRTGKVVKLGAQTPDSDHAPLIAPVN